MLRGVDETGNGLWSRRIDADIQDNTDHSENRTTKRRPFLSLRDHRGNKGFLVGVTDRSDQTSELLFLDPADGETIRRRIAHPSPPILSAEYGPVWQFAIRGPNGQSGAASALAGSRYYPLRDRDPDRGS